MTTNVKFENGNLIVRRIYAAKIQDVFDAWIETSKLEQWWGCAECTQVRSEVEPKLGGKYNHHMKIENEYGEFDVPGSSVIIAYDPPFHLSYRSTDESDPMIISVSFKEVEGGTEVEMIQSNIPDVTVQGNVKLHKIVQEGWTASFDKLIPVLEGRKAA